MPVRIRTAAISGIDAAMVDVEVETRQGKALFVLGGLGDAAVRESRQRVAVAVESTGFTLPGQVLVNLAPAEVRKEGAAFDLPIALGVLCASRQIPAAPPPTISIHGELSLDGQVRPIRGVVALTIEARRAGIEQMIVPRQNLEEAALISGIEVIGVESLAELVGILIGESPVAVGVSRNLERSAASSLGFADVVGQERAKRALEVAAAGGHNLLMVGPPGCGKSMLAERFSGILPVLSEAELLDVVRVHSVAGLPLDQIFAGARPLRAPHHGISDAGLIGGGSIPRPGEISLAHRGVLFLDEFPEFRRSALEALRAPLETGVVHIARTKASLSFPAKFQLLAAMNPCPCGRFGSRGASCFCSRGAIEKYLQRISQPILDRIDLQVEMDAISVGMLGQRSTPIATDLTERVTAARERAHHRSQRSNSELGSQEVRDLVTVSGSALRLLEAAEQRVGLSARGVIRVLKVARTIADLGQSEQVADEHLAEALGFRSLDRLRPGSTHS